MQIADLAPKVNRHVRSERCETAAAIRAGSATITMPGFVAMSYVKE